MVSNAPLELTDEEQAEADKQVRKIRQWLNTTEGKRRVLKASAKAKTARKVREDKRRVDPCDLLKRTPG